MNERIGVMDLGTNTFHLLIAEIQGNRFQVIHRDRRPVKIGKGGINQRTILPDAIDRAASCMKAFRARLDDERVSRFYAFGTSALRDATNQRAVLEAIRNASGIDVEIISGHQEAEYIYHGVRTAVPLGSDPALIVDIGGGSVEFIIGNDHRIFWKTSLDIGAQRLLERYHRHDPILPEELAALNEQYSSSLQTVARAIGELNPTALVGSSGTFDTLSEIYCTANGIPYPAEKAETPLTVEAFREIHQMLVSTDRAGRMQIPGMIEMRVDMIVVASCLINYLLQLAGFRSIRVSSYSLKEGVLSVVMDRR